MCIVSWNMSLYLYLVTEHVAIFILCHGTCRYIYIVSRNMSLYLCCVTEHVAMFILCHGTCRYVYIVSRNMSLCIYTVYLSAEDERIYVKQCKCNFEN
jgi:hypothetical protein